MRKFQKITLFFLISIIAINCNNNTFNQDGQLVSDYSGSQCGDAKCSDDFGICYDGVCKCTLGFSTFPSESANKCNYKQVKQLNVFLLELFLSFGAGHFYSGKMDLAGAKVTLFLFCLMMNLITFSLKFCYQKNNKFWRVLFLVTLICSLILIFVWQVVDLALIGQNKYTDGNNMDLYGWS